jgi:predicted RNA-binding protein with PUA-like domain
MALWLLKTEPSAYSFADLRRDGVTAWTGVANPTAQKNLRAMKVGDRAFVYHTGDEMAAVGVGRVVRAAYADPTAGDPRLCCVDLKPLAELRTPVPLAALKGDPAFLGSPLVTQGRLSVVPLSAAQGKALERLARAGATAR